MLSTNPQPPLGSRRATALSAAAAADADAARRQKKRRRRELLRAAGGGGPTTASAAAAHRRLVSCTNGNIVPEVREPGGVYGVWVRVCVRESEYVRVRRQNEQRLSRGG